MQDIEAALRGYLKHQSTREPWMYEMFAVALEWNRADDNHIRRALGYAAILAERAGDQSSATSLLSVADLLYARDAFEVEVPLSEGESRTIRVGELLDLAAERRPDLPGPLIRSIELAELRSDPERMGRSVERLLALGWPGTDEQWRAEVRDRAERMAGRLRERGEDEAAERLLARLDAAQPRDVFARLTWDGFGDLDLEVDEPLGATAKFETPRTVFGGAIVRRGSGSDAEEVYSCPRGFDGTYTFRLRPIVSDPKEPITAATLEVILHEGGPDERVQVFELDPEDPEPVRVTLEGGRRTEVLPYIVPKVMVLEGGDRKSGEGDGSD